MSQQLGRRPSTGWTRALMGPAVTAAQPSAAGSVAAWCMHAGLKGWPRRRPGAGYLSPGPMHILPVPGLVAQTPRGPQHLVRLSSALLTAAAMGGAWGARSRACPPH